MLPKFPGNFGKNATDMTGAFAGFGVYSNAKSISMYSPNYQDNSLPIDFGKNTTDMTGMFYGFGAYSTVSGEISPFNKHKITNTNFGEKVTNVSYMFASFSFNSKYYDFGWSRLGDKFGANVKIATRMFDLFDAYGTRTSKDSRDDIGFRASPRFLSKAENVDHMFSYFDAKQSSENDNYSWDIYFANIEIPANVQGKSTMFNHFMQGHSDTYIKDSTIYLGRNSAQMKEFFTDAVWPGTFNTDPITL
jgi:hypothetical protein